MKILKLAVAAAIALSGLAAGLEPAAAADQRGDRWEHRDHRDRDWRGDRGRRDRWRGHRGRYGYNWRYNRGRHYGWRGHRVCRWVWRYGHRQRVCWRR